MGNIWFVWLQFAVSVSVIVYAGVKLSYLGDTIAEKTGISRGWIGLVLLSFVTSLPELMTSLGAVLFEDIPNLALGNVFGSNMFNILVLVIIDLFRTEGPLLLAASPKHSLPAAVGIGMMAIAGLNIASASLPSPVTWGSLGWIGIGSIIILIVYFLGMRLLYQCEKRWKWDREETGVCHECGKNLSCANCGCELGGRGTTEEEEEESPVEEPPAEEPSAEDAVAAYYAKLTLKKAIILFAVFAAVTVADGVWLASLGDKIAMLQVTFRGNVVSLGTTFVGSLFIAFATSLPEFVVSFGAIRLGAVDMAVGNIVGSNIFNIAIIGIADLLYVKGPIMALNKDIHGVATAGGHILAALCAMLLTSIVIVALVQEDRRGYTKLKIGWYTPLVMIIYLLGMYLIFVSGVGK